jgi:Protein of unknown function (DUF4232)
MKLTQLAGRKAIAAAAITGAVVLLPVAALASTAGASAPASTPGCATSGLVVWMNTKGDGFAGGVGYTLNFTNLSGHACTLHGTPGVSAVNLSGHQLGRSASGNYSGDTPTVRLASGATATALLTIYDPANFGIECFLPGPPPSPGHPGKLPTAAGLRIYPPGQRASKVIPFPISACASSRPVWLNAGPVQK